LNHLAKNIDVTGASDKQVVAPALTSKKWYQILACVQA